MTGNGRHPFGCLILLAGLIGGLTEAHALNIQSLRPSTGAVKGFHLYTTETMEQYRLATGLIFNFDHHPLEVSIAGGGSQGVVDRMITADFLVSYGLLNWLNVNVDFPFNLYHDIAPVLIATRDRGGFDPGDLSIGVKARILDLNLALFRLGLAIAPSMTLPTGRESIFFGDSSATGTITAVGDIDWLSNRIYMNLGTRFRENETVGNVTVGDEFVYGLGFQRPIVKSWDLDVIGEIYGSTSFNNFFSRETALPVELLALLQKKWLDRQLISHLGMGVGLTQGYGTPVFRVIAGAAYVFSVAQKKEPEPPPPPPVKVIELREEIKFEPGKAAILPRSYPTLDDVVTRLKVHSEIKKLLIEGHTDSTGSDVYNQKLSENRAVSVKQYLVEHGIAEKRLETVGYGESQPIADNKTAAGRKLNRRVVLRIVK